MKKSRRKIKYSFKEVKSPYKVRNTDTWNDIYQRYTEDNDKIFEKDELTYYRIIECREFKINSMSMLVTLDYKMNLKVNDKLIDENGVTYDIKGFEMFRISIDEFPEWYSKVTFVLLDGNPYGIGYYLARFPQENETAS